MTVIRTLFLGLSLFSTFAMAKLECAKNNGDQNIKRICLLTTKASKVSGFLLYNANGTKSYLTVVKEKQSGFAIQEYGHREWAYTVKRSDSNLVAKDNVTSKITIVQSWEYSDGGTYLSGTTPGGRSLHAVLEEGDGSK